MNFEYKIVVSFATNNAPKLRGKIHFVPLHRLFYIELVTKYCDPKLEEPSMIMLKIHWNVIFSIKRGSFFSFIATKLARVFNYSICKIV